MRRPNVVTLLIALGTVMMSLGFALFLIKPASVIRADEPQDITPFEDFACLDCHTDKARLTELAAEVPQEEEAALSSGPG